MISEVKFLDSIQVAAPCSVAWEGMEGDDRKRFCDQCHKNVYDLSGMSRKQAEALVRESEGQLCVTFYRRADGTVLTDNCPVGLRAVRNAAVRRWVATASLAASLLAVVTGALAQTPSAAKKAKKASSSEKATGNSGSHETKKGVQPEHATIVNVKEKESVKEKAAPGPIYRTVGRIAFTPRPKPTPPEVKEP